MIPERLFKEVRDLLEKSKNPLYLFDDDPDGLSSFLLLYKHYGKKGHGIPLKVGMKDERIYQTTINQYKPDLVIILDRAEISQELIYFIKVPLIWVDHHPPQERTGLKYYVNPMLYDKTDNRPTTYWSYQITGPDKELLWIAGLGVSADWHVNEVTEEFSKRYGDILPSKVKTQGDILFNTSLGKLVKIFGFMLKGDNKDIKKSIETLANIKDPYELLKGESEDSKYLNKRYEKVNKEYERIMEDACKSFDTKDRLLVYIYPAREISLTGSISTELLHRFPKHIIILGRQKGNNIYMSLRSGTLPVSDALREALKHVRGYGGGHKMACGASVDKDDFPRFLEEFRKNLKI